MEKVISLWLYLVAIEDYMFIIMLVPSTFLFVFHMLLRDAVDGVVYYNGLQETALKIFFLNSILCFIVSFTSPNFSTEDFFYAFLALILGQCLTFHKPYSYTAASERHLPKSVNSTKSIAGDA